MHVLITNDDGIQAAGLLALKQAVEQVAQVTVMAPSTNWSASGHVKTMHKPLRVSETTLADGSTALTTTGAPSDCVALAFMGIVSPAIDMVISGINAGPNLGHDVTYSGTVTAAMEGVIAGVPSIAVSLNSFASSDFGFAARFAARLAVRLLDESLPPFTLLNVNVPSVPENEIAGVMITRQGLRLYHDELIRRVDPRGRPYYWIGGEPLQGELQEGTDEWAVEHRYVSITPLQLDLTAHGLLERLREWNLNQQ
ncbi:MAG: 5'/3'-nucleotidase SurE [Chloroflexota bacterium]